MKTLELNLEKRLLIVEAKNEGIAKSWIFVNHGMKTMMDSKLICKGSELTDEIAEALVYKTALFEGGGMHYQNYKQLIGKEWFFTALQSFISAIESKGYHWGDNPVEEPAKNDLNGSFFTMQQNFHKEKKYEEADSKTFNPDKTLIFEIL